ncbi:MAG: diguanylate cyclase [Deltaproteobacteria bacterium]|jgi:diguanylate cyclase (GGDEF)-like protein|nr:diguanylate cyclase [Deltaproteobacteria bacterium]
MQTSTILVIDPDGSEMPRISSAARPFGSRIMWADTAEEGSRLMAEARPELILASDAVPGLPDPRKLLDDMARLKLASQLVVLSADPGFDRSMEMVADGIFTVLRKPADQERLRGVIRKVLDGLQLMATLVARSPRDSERELEIYKRLARSQELGPLASAVCEAGDALAPGVRTTLELAGELGQALASLRDPGARNSAAGFAACPGIAPGGDDADGDGDGMFPPGACDGEDGMFSFDAEPPAPAPAARIVRELSFRGAVLGTLTASFPDLDPAEAPPALEGLDELVWAASLHLYRAKQYQEAVRLASRDPLTSLLNRRAFMECLDREFAKAGRHNTPLSLIMLDIDHFKSVNDTFGHQTGDKILKWVSQVMAGTVRTGDIVGRIGGEEFAILLPWTDQDQARNLAERIREGLAKARRPTRSALLRPTVSQGISTLEHFLINSPEDLIYWSDQAMYLAKREGRDTVRAASDLRPDPMLEEHRYVFQ